MTQRFHTWCGASGTHYIHTVHSLIECPELTGATYLLVRRTGNGRRRVLAVGRTKDAAPSLNLAEIRYRGAWLGVNEVHVYALAESDYARRLVEADIGNRWIKDLKR
ncbi:MAG: hypothetical protein ACREC6_01025 [Hyphomicrobiaceae bacterium]